YFRLRIDLLHARPARSTRQQALQQALQQRQIISIEDGHAPTQASRLGRSDSRASSQASSRAERGISKTWSSCGSRSFTFVPDDVPPEEVVSCYRRPAAGPTPPSSSADPAAATVCDRRP